MNTEYIKNLKADLSPEKAQLLLSAQNLLEYECDELSQDLKTQYMVRSYNTASILYSLRLDINTIIAGLLHGIYKMGIIDDDKVLEFSNEEVLCILQSLSKVENIEHNLSESEAENIRNMFVALAKDIRVIIVKLADVKETLSNYNLLSEKEKRTIIEETKNIYSPLAERLGLNSIKGDLEDYIFKYQNPKEYQKLNKILQIKYKERNEQVVEAKIKLFNVMKELGIDAEISGRQKRINSVYKKINNKTHDINSIYDIVALRVIVKTVEQCYQVLGKVHTIYKPMNNRFKDYVAIPKKNGYQSLHTTVINENNEPIEIQIRTEEMHQYAEYGIAAHWVYKEAGKQSIFDKKFGWIRRIMEDSKNLTAEEFVDTLKTDIFSGEIFVQSPQGKIINLPEGATPIDFAYAIHSSIGEKCVGAKINGKMVPLSTPMQNGDIIEIITSKQSKGPSRDWQNIVKTSSAKAKIKAYFKRETKDENIKDGKNSFEQFAKSKNVELYKLLDKKYLDVLFRRYTISNIDEMYASIGFGALSSNQVLNKLENLYLEDKKEALFNKQINVLGNNEVFEVRSSKNDADAIIVKGESNMLTRFAGCCNPIPGDEIIGFVSRGRGVTIHRKDCPNVPNLDNDRLIKCAWEKDRVSSFSVSLRVIAIDSPGTLVAISSCVASQKINISSISSRKQSKDKSIIDLTVMLTKIEQVKMVINELKNLSQVEDVYRSSTY